VQFSNAMFSVADSGRFDIIREQTRAREAKKEWDTLVCDVGMIAANVNYI